jgi:hypothetical protein
MGAAGRRRAAVAAIAAFALVLPATASAEIREIALEGGVLEIKAGNERDVLEVEAGRKSVLVADSDPAPVAQAPCKAGPSGNVIRCPRKQVDEVHVDMGDADDVFTGAGDIRFEVDGDLGDDRLTGGDAPDLLEGRLENDTIDGGDGNDDVFGGLGDDRMKGKGGRDLLDGGPGDDRGAGGAGKDDCPGVEQANCEKEYGKTGTVPSVPAHQLR